MASRRRLTDPRRKLANTRATDEMLDEALSLGFSYAGVVTFSDLCVAVARARHHVVSAVRRPDGRYEVVLETRR